MRKRTKLKLKTGFKVLIVLIILGVIGGIIGYNKYQEYLYHQTYEYKLLQNNYTMDEIKLLLDKLPDERIDKLLETKKHDDDLLAFLKEKYFIYKNLDRYIEYYNHNFKLGYSDVVTLVNVNRDRDFYTDPIETKVSDDILMLVNKYYHLKEDYVPNNIVPVGSSYGYENNSAREDVLNAFISMYEAAKKEDIVLIINSSYRNYADQDEIWNTRKNTKGIEKADAYAARAGYSEHQTGLSLDIIQFNCKEENFEDCPAYPWLFANSYKYGFILRYPEGKENITGYDYESWHYRYIGKEMAEKVYKENITYDEYYAYYIENKQS